MPSDDDPRMYWPRVEADQATRELEPEMETGAASRREAAAEAREAARTR